MRWVGTASLIGLLLTAPLGLIAAPMPWLISNHNPEGSSTLVRDMNGDVLQRDVRVDLIMDTYNTGYNHPSNAPGEVGNPTGDDVLIASWIARAETDYLPNGAFALMLTVDTDSLPIPPGRRGYVRVFEAGYPGPASRYCNSEFFVSPVFPGEAQTVVVLPEQMNLYLGNEPPELRYNPWSVTVAEGDEAVFTMRGVDTRVYWEILEFGLLEDSLPGGTDAFQMERIGWDRVRVSYIPPFGTQGETRIRGWVSDGEYTIPAGAPLTITAPGDNPSAFHLVSPRSSGTLWEDQGFSWQPAVDPQNQDVTYTFYWGRNWNFSDADSMSGLTETELIVPFQQRMQSKPKPGGEIGLLEEAGTVRKTARGQGQVSLEGGRTDDAGGLSSQALRGSRGATTRGGRGAREASGVAALEPESGESQAAPTGSELDELDIAEGDTLYWRVRAYDPDGNSRLSSEEHWWVVAEVADAPGEFALAGPEDGATVATLAPTLTWETAVDPDVGDTVRYELHWSLDGGATTDTVFGLTDTSFTFTDAGMLDLPGAEEFYVALLSCFDAGAGELNDLPNHADVTWTVWAEDVTGRRTQADDTWLFTIDAATAPGGFTLASPAPETVFDRPMPLLLSWTEAVDEGETVTYDILAIDDPEVTEIGEFDVVASDLAATQFIFDPGEQDHTWWRWTVRAINGHDTTWAVRGQTPWARFGISTPTRPEPFALVSPADGSDAPTTPTLRWDRPQQPDLADPITYTLYYSLDNWATTDSITAIPDTAFFVTPDPENLSHPGALPAPAITKGKTVAPRATSSLTSELDEFPEGATVVWKVRAADTNSRGRWCTAADGWSFTTYVDEPPTAFSLQSPADGSEIADSTAQFSWETSSDPEGFEGLHYKFYLADNPEFEDADSLVAESNELTVSMVGRRVGDFWWRVAAVDSVFIRTWSRETWSGVLSYVVAPEEEAEILPTEFAIASAYPNPFNPTLNVVVAAPQPQRMVVTVFDILGRRVMKLDPQVYQPGFTPLHLDFSRYPSGVYFVRLDGPAGMINAKKVVLLK